MKPIDFPQSTKVLQRPEEMLDTDCKPLPVWSDGKECVSCWRPTFKERLKILVSGKVWLSVLCGRTQPPVYITGEHFFVRPPFRARVRLFLEDVWDNTTAMFKSLVSASKEADKRKHFFVGAIISLLWGCLIPLLGFAFGCIAGAIKEWWDSKGHGTVELMDFVFTCIGAAFGLALSSIIHLFL
ncbi:MAG: hypothetical protein NC110_00140 [Ruminococcus sp.]|nr:hypothetical protein [Ruminococcus sp.]